MKNGVRDTKPEEQRVQENEERFLASLEMTAKAWREKQRARYIVRTRECGMQEERNDTSARCLVPYGGWLEKAGTMYRARTVTRCGLGRGWRGLGRAWLLPGKRARRRCDWRRRSWRREK